MAWAALGSFNVLGVSAGRLGGGRVESSIQGRALVEAVPGVVGQLRHLRHLRGSRLLLGAPVLDVQGRHTCGPKNCASCRVTGAGKSGAALPTVLV
jgi:hypothetical protein